MKFVKSFLFITAICVLTTIVANAQVPAQTAPAKVGVVNTEMFSSTTNGITRYVNSLRTLENEFRARRDEIAQLIARFEELQRPLPAGTPVPQMDSRREQAQSLQIQITRKQEDARVAYTKRFAQLTDPIQKSMIAALTVFARSRGIDVLIDVSKFPEGVLLVNQNVDLTAAFIRDFNTKNP